MDEVLGGLLKIMGALAVEVVVEGTDLVGVTDTLMLLTGALEVELEGRALEQDVVGMGGLLEMTGEVE